MSDKPAPWTLERLQHLRAQIQQALAQGSRPTKVIRRAFRVPVQRDAMTDEAAEALCAIFNLWGVVESSEGNHREAASILRDALGCAAAEPTIVSVRRNLGCALIADTLRVNAPAGGGVGMLEPAAFPDFFRGGTDDPHEYARLMALVPHEFELALRDESDDLWREAWANLSAAARMVPGDDDVRDQARLASALFGLGASTRAVRARAACLREGLALGDGPDENVSRVMRSALADLLALPAPVRWLGRARVSRGWARLRRLLVVRIGPPEVTTAFRGYAFRVAS